MTVPKLNETSKTIFLAGFIKHSCLIVCCIIALSISACGGNKDNAPVEETVENIDAQATETATSESTKASSNDIASEVQTNREKWMSHEISSYEIEMQKICYCVPEVVRMMVFEVDNNKVETVRYADTGETVDPQHYGNFNTIEGMFTFIEQSLEKNPADLSIAYDQKYGYIKEVNVDFKENIADDEISIIASNMRPR